MPPIDAVDGRPWPHLAKETLDVINCSGCLHAQRFCFFSSIPPETDPTPSASTCWLAPPINDQWDSISRLLSAKWGVWSSYCGHHIINNI
ncbi:hypothetical protein AFLA_001489 [Aspergillus flavus NRRL3357]|nr:hypothetical protein AFLA_001489 [Aspergillus flavus NRRL3357]